MNQEKIGKFIASCRKAQKLTQEEVAEKLNITYKAVSKWETGKGLPDASIMKELCNILNISVNDLLSGELTKKEDYSNKLEENLFEMLKLKQEKDKQLLNLEIFIGVTFSLILFICVFVGAFANIQDSFKIIIIVFGFVFFLTGCLYALRIEQIAGYYKCDKCGNKYIPTYKSMLVSQHVNRTRKMKCPKCGKKSWQRKILN